MEEGVNSSYYSLLFPDRETEAKTLSNFAKVTKLGSVQDLKPGLIDRDLNFLLLFDDISNSCVSQILT